MLTTHQAAWLLAGLGASSLANSTGYLWTQRVNSKQALIILWVLLGVSGGSFLFGGLLSLAFSRRRIWQWAAWFTAFAIGAADVLYVWEFGLFGFDWTFAMTIAAVSTALVLSLVGIIVDDWRRNRAAKVGSSTNGQLRDAHESVCSLSGILAIACAVVLCGLSAALFADAMLEFQKLAATDSLRNTASLIKWIVIGINGGMVLILALWFFIAGARDALREEKAAHVKAYSPPSTQIQATARTQPQMVTRPDEYIMAAALPSQQVPAPAPQPVVTATVAMPGMTMEANKPKTPGSGAAAGLRTMTCTRNYRAVERVSFCWQAPK